MDNPLVRWLLEGAFMYFDHKYDIVGINTVFLQEDTSKHAQLQAESSAIYLGNE
jgi:hypothetical protein